MAEHKNNKALQALYDSLVKHRRIFLENVTAQMYGLATDPPPKPFGEWHPGDQWEEYWTPVSRSLTKERERREQGKNDILDADAEAFGETLLEEQGPDGKRWRIDRIMKVEHNGALWALPMCEDGRVFDTLHEEDREALEVSDHWLVADSVASAALERSAQKVELALADAWYDVVAVGSQGLREKVPQLARDGLNCWRARPVRWTYLRDLTLVISELCAFLGPAAGGGRRGKKAKFATRFAEAYKAYDHAIRSAPELEHATDRKVYEWLEGHPYEGYELPPFDTWSRYVREARQYYKTQKASPRAGREGRSIVKPDQV